MSKAVANGLSELLLGTFMFCVTYFYDVWLTNYDFLIKKCGKKTPTW